MKYITDDKKMMNACEIVETMVAHYAEKAFDRSGWNTIDEQLYALNEMIAYLKGLKNVYEGKPSGFYGYLNE